MTTRAQAESNKTNAQKSTGPKTLVGKKRSSLNGLIHGLRSEEVVLPGEDAAAFEAERAAWFEDWKPQSQTRAVLVERAAVAAWRCRRCVRIETERLRGLGRTAIKHFDADIAGRQNAAINRFVENPRQALMALESFREGTDELIGLWTTLANAANSVEQWGASTDSHELLLNLIGLEDGADAEDGGPVCVGSWRLLDHVQPEIGESRYGPLDASTAARSLRNLQTFIADKINTYRAGLRRFLDPAVIRDRISLKASVDTSEDAKLMLRYEATHDRSLRATISSLIQLEKSGADLIGAEPEPTPEAVAPSEPIGPKPIAAKPLTQATKPKVDSEPLRLADVVPPAVVPAALAQSDRDRGGRSWEPDDIFTSLKEI